MPFIVTTKRPATPHSAFLDAPGEHFKVSRRAVATLEEAIEAICKTAPFPPRDPQATPLAERFRSGDLSPITFSDGTVIEVARQP